MIDRCDPISFPQLIKRQVEAVTRQYGPIPITIVGNKVDRKTSQVRSNLRSYNKSCFLFQERMWCTMM